MTVFSLSRVTELLQPVARPPIMQVYDLFTEEERRLAVAVFAGVIALGLDVDGEVCIADETGLAEATMYAGADGPATARLIVARKQGLSPDSIALVAVWVLLGICPHQVMSEITDNGVVQTLYAVDLSPLWEARK